MTEQATLPESAKWYKVRTGIDSSIPFVLARSTRDPFTVALDTSHEGLAEAIELGRFNLRLIPHAQKTFVQRCAYSWAPAEVEQPEHFLIAAKPEDEGDEAPSEPTAEELAELEAAKKKAAEAEAAAAEAAEAEAAKKAEAAAAANKAAGGARRSPNNN